MGKRSVPNNTVELIFDEINMGSKNPFRKEEAEFDCIKCEFFCNDKKSFQKHLNEHDKRDRPFGCLHCEFRAATKKKLTDHNFHSHLAKYCRQCCKIETTSKCLCDNYIQSGNHKTFKCSSCDLSTKYRWYMNIHEKVHRNIREYPCSFCQVSFVKRSVLASHIRTHTGEKPYKCEFCKTDYSHRLVLTYHQKSRRCKKNIREISANGSSESARTVEKRNRKVSLHQSQDRTRKASCFSTGVNSVASASEALTLRQYAIRKTISLPVLLPLTLLTHWRPGQNPYNVPRKIKQIGNTNCRFLLKGKIALERERCRYTERCKVKSKLIPTNLDSLIRSECRKHKTGITKPEQPLLIDISQDSCSSSNNEWTSDAPKYFQSCAASSLISMPVLLPQIIPENWTYGENTKNDECIKAGNARKSNSTLNSKIADKIRTEDKNHEFLNGKPRQPVLIDISEDCSSSDEFSPEAPKNSGISATLETISGPILLPLGISEDFKVTQSSTDADETNEKKNVSTNFDISSPKNNDVMQEIAVRFKKKPGNPFYSKKHNFTCPDCTFTCYREDRLLRHRLRNHV